MRINNNPVNPKFKNRFLSEYNTESGFKYHIKNGYEKN